jgi:hypothetical protein
MSELFDADLVSRLSALPEPHVLNYFWMMRREGVPALELLAQLSKVRIKRPASWNPAKIRKQHEAGDGMGPADKQQCFGCTATNRRLYSHHIVEVFHGGSNDVRNKVALCFGCHKTLHPWLTEEPPPSHVNGFESLYDIAKRVFA